MLTLPNSRSFNLAALSYLRESKSGAANAALRAALDTVRDSELQVKVANGLLLQGDASTLKFIKQIFLTRPRISVPLNNQEILGNAMAFHLKDPAAIPDLEELLEVSSVSIRRGAAGALRGTGSPQAVKGLVKALEDTDSEVRYWAVSGLAEIINKGEGRPSAERFKSCESDYISNWKEWARKQ